MFNELLWGSLKCMHFGNTYRHIGYFWSIRNTINICSLNWFRCSSHSSHSTSLISGNILAYFLETVTASEKNKTKHTHPITHHPSNKPNPQILPSARCSLSYLSHKVWMDKKNTSTQGEKLQSHLPVQRRLFF